MKGYLALQVAVEEGKKIRFQDKKYEYVNGILFNQENKICTISFDDLMADGWVVMEEIFVK